MGYYYPTIPVNLIHILGLVSLGYLVIISTRAALYALLVATGTTIIRNWFTWASQLAHLLGCIFRDRDVGSIHG